MEEENNKWRKVIIYLAVALFSVLFLFLIFYYISNGSDENLEEKEVTYVADDMNDCLSVSLFYAISKNSISGGYLDLPSRSDEKSLRPYYFYGPEVFVPDKLIIERELEKVVDLHVLNCAYLLTDVSQEDLNVSFGVPYSDVTIGDNYVSAELSWPISVSVGDREDSVQKFYAKLEPVRLGILLKAAKEIAESQVKDSRSVCFDCIEAVTAKYDLDLDMYQTEVRGQYIFDLQDYDSIIGGSLEEDLDSFPVEHEPHIFSFMGQYNFPECTDLESCTAAIS